MSSLFSNAWHGLAGGVDNVSQSTGLDHFIRAIPGSDQDGKRAAEIAALVTAGVVAWPYLAAAGAGSAAGAGAGAAAAGEGAAAGGSGAALSGAGYGGLLNGTEGTTAALNSAGMADYGAMGASSGGFASGAGGGSAASSFMNPQRAKMLANMLQSQSQSSQGQGQPEQIPYFDQPDYPQQPQALPVMNNPYSTGLAGNPYGR